MSNQSSQEVRKIKTYGWKPDMPDHRDYYFLPRIRKLNLPPSVDLRPLCPAVYDQGDLGSCTTNSSGAIFQFLMMKQKMISFIPSRLFIYWNERFLEGGLSNTLQDTGAENRDAIKILATLGGPNESLWWYDTKKFTVKPNKSVFAQAVTHKLGEYSRIDNSDINNVKSCLAQGYPIVFGFTVYDAFESDEVAKTGVLNMPAKTEKQLGGHSTLIVGFRDDQKRVIVRNSWGPNWGQGGYFTMPYDYITDSDLSDDYWTAHEIVVSK